MQKHKSQPVAICVLPQKTYTSKVSPLEATPGMFTAQITLLG